MRRETTFFFRYPKIAIALKFNLELPIARTPQSLWIGRKIMKIKVASYKHSPRILAPDRSIGRVASFIQFGETACYGAMQIREHGLTRQASHAKLNATRLYISRFRQ